jgi:hypothetical protein
VGHQRVRRIERTLDGELAVMLLALRDIALREVEIIENPLRIRPLLEQVVVLEEMVMAEGSVRNHQRLHRRGVLLHQVGDTWRAIDHDLIGKPHQAPAIERLLMREMLAERPVLVEQRHADRRIGVEHLLRGDDLDLVGIDVEPEFLQRDTLTGVVDPLQHGKIPVRTFEQAASRYDASVHETALS